MNGKARRVELLVLILAWLAFAVRVIGLDFQSLWRDEVDALRFATRSLPELLATFRTPGENGPLFFLALRPWLAVEGHSEFALRFPSALAGTLAAPVIYVLVRRLAGRSPALIAALLETVSPYLVWYGQEAKMYAALTLLAPLSLWLTVEAARQGGWWRWLLLYLVTTLCFYTHLLAALIVPVQAIWLLILLTSRHTGLGEVPCPKWRQIAAVIYLAALFAPYLPLLRWQAGTWLSPFETGHPFVPLGSILAVLAVAFSGGVLPVQAPITLLPVVLALVSGIGFWATQAVTTRRTGTAGGWPSVPDRWRVVALLAVWLFLPPVTVYGISLGMPLFTDRYLIWCLPAFLALAALGIVALARVWRPLGAGILGAVLLVSLVGVWAQGARPIKSDFRAAARFVLAHERPGDLLLFQIPYGRYTFDYYANGGTPGEPWAIAQLPAMDGPFTNNGESEDALAAQMAQGTASAQAVWLVASEVSLWDKRDLTRGWLSANAEVTDQADFTRVSVTRYDLKRQ